MTTTPTTERSRVRSATVAALGWVPAAAVLTSGPALLHRLPETIATHWSSLDAPDGFSGRDTTWAVVVGLTVTGALAATVAGLPRLRSTWTSWLAVTGAATAGVAASVRFAIAGATLTAGSPARPSLGWWLLLVLAGLAWALPALLLLDHGTRDDHGPEAPPLDLAPGERAAWSRTSTSLPLVLASTVGLAAAVGVALAVPAVWPVAVVPVVVLLVLCRIQVTVDHRGLRVVAGLLGLPLKRIPLDRIARAGVERVNPREWGGWGYRVGPGRSAVVLRAGDGVVVRTVDDRRFAVTVDDAASGAALLTTLRTGRPTSRTDVGQVGLEPTT